MSGEDVIVYYITGRQLGPLSIPQRWCEECDLTVRAVQSALREADTDQQLQFAAKPWLKHLLPLLLRGAWHPPVVLIGGNVFSQGVVPSRDALVEGIRELLESAREGTRRSRVRA